MAVAVRLALHFVQRFAVRRRWRWRTGRRARPTASQDDASVESLPAHTVGAVRRFAITSVLAGPFVERRAIRPARRRGTVALPGSPGSARARASAGAPGTGAPGTGVAGRATLRDFERRATATSRTEDDKYKRHSRDRLHDHHDEQSLYRRGSVWQIARGVPNARAVPLRDLRFLTPAYPLGARPADRSRSSPGRD